MSPTSTAPPAMKTRSRLVVLIPLLLGGCAGGSGPGTDASPAPVDEDVWAALLEPRPEPMQGAPRLTVGEISLAEASPWGADAAVPAALGVRELVSAGLLRRRDVHFVERRRFAAAAERERRGLPRPEGAPPVGVSPGAEFVLTGSWVAPMGPGTLELRLVDTETGESVDGWRVALSEEPDPAALARVAVGSALARLDSLAGLPAWDDPIPAAALESPQATGVPAAAFEAFLEGVAAEDRYDWESARRAYQRAARLGGEAFFEPDVALARVARLRAGGSLAGS